jgi:hypothetical protein
LRIERYSKDSEVEIISIEGPNPSCDLELRSRKYRTVKFILLKDKLSTGEKINIAVEEARTKFIFFIWNDMQINSLQIIKKIAEKAEDYPVLCIVPLFKTYRSETIPTMMVPGMIKNVLKVIPMKEDSMNSIFPFDYCGLYNREKFILLGGYDSEIEHPYWQKMDFGFRAHLWDENIMAEPSASVQYTGEVISEDTTPDKSYKKFYLKNIAVRYKNGTGYLPFSKYFHYILHSDTGPFVSFKEFKDVRRWVRENQKRFKKDARSLIELWKPLE